MALSRLRGPSRGFRLGRDRRPHTILRCPIHQLLGPYILLVSVYLAVLALVFLAFVDVLYALQPFPQDLLGSLVDLDVLLQAVGSPLLQLGFSLA